MFFFFLIFDTKFNKRRAFKKGIGYVKKLKLINIGLNFIPEFRVHDK